MVLKSMILLLLGFFVVGCSSNKGLSSDKVFTQAQIQYTRKNEGVIINKKATFNPSYYLALQFEPGQTQLNSRQLNQIQSLIKKIDYPDEYDLYLSLGMNQSLSDFSKVAIPSNRAKNIKRIFDKKVKRVKVAILPNQDENSVYLRFLA